MRVMRAVWLEIVPLSDSIKSCSSKEMNEQEARALPERILRILHVPVRGFTICPSNSGCQGGGVELGLQKTTVSRPFKVQ